MIEAITKDEYLLLKFILIKLEKKFEPSIKKFYLDVLFEIEKRMNKSVLIIVASDAFPGICIYTENFKYADIIFSIIDFLERDKLDEKQNTDVLAMQLLDNGLPMNEKVSCYIDNSNIDDYAVQETEHSLCKALSIENIICAYY